MVRIEEYMSKLAALLQKEFGDELIYVGLQGSYLRGEATENSDIDAMVILERIDRDVLNRYRGVLAKTEESDKACGFICSRKDMLAWNPLECCQLVHTTKDVYGSLQPLLPAWTREDERNYVKLSLNNLYHELCHRYIYRGPERSAETLPYMEKSLFFILQNLHYLDTGVFCKNREQLKQVLGGIDREIYSLACKAAGGDFAFDEMFDALLNWCQLTTERI